MTYEELINLQTFDAIEKINEFLKDHSLDDEYYSLVSHLVELYYLYNQEKLAITVLEEIMKSLTGLWYLQMQSQLLRGYILIGEYGNAQKLIEEEKQNELKADSQWKLDLACLNWEIGQYEVVDKVLDDINIEDLDSFDQERLAIILVKKDLLKDSEQFNDHFAFPWKYFFGEAQSLYLRHLVKIEDYDTFFIEKDDNMVSRYLEILTFWQQKNYHRAEVLAVEYEQEFLTLDNCHLQKEYFALLIELYERLQNQLSVNYFQEKYDRIVEFLAQQQLAVIKEPLFLQTKGQSVDVDELYRSIELMLRTQQSIFDSGLTMPLRENWRSTLNKFSEIAVFDRAVLAITKQEKVHVIEYKKGRAYDYVYEAIRLDNTVEGKVVFSGSELILSSNDEIMQLDDLVKQQPIMHTSVMGFPINNDGAIVFYGDEKMILKKLNYELLRFFGSSFAYYILDYNSLDIHRQQFADYGVVISQSPSFIKYMIDDELFLNDALQTCLQLSANINIHDYIVTIDKAYVNKYKEACKQLMTGVVNEFDMRYQMVNGMWFHEKARACRVGHRNYILSELIDISDLVKLETTKSAAEVYCSLTGLKNRREAIIDLEKAIATNRFSMIVLDIDRFKYYNEVFSTLVGDEALKTIAKATVEIFDKHQVYRLMSDELLIIFLDTNDQRTVQNRAQKLLHELEYRVIKVNPQFKLKYSLGLFRFPMQSRDKSPERLLKYAFHAVYMAKRSKKNMESTYAYFDINDYQNYQSEQMLVQQVSDAIDEKRMVVKYQQVIDITKERVAHYEAQAHLSSYAKTDQYVYEVAIKRGIVYTIDRFLIQTSLAEIKTIYQKTGKFIKVSLPVHISSFIRIDFMTFLQNEMFKNDLKPEVVMIEVIGCFSNSPAAIQRLLELKKDGFRIIANEIMELIKVPADYFKIRDLNLYLKEGHTRQMLNQISQMLESLGMGLIVDDVKKKDEYATLNMIGVKYAEGSLYGARLSVTDILKKIGDKYDQ